MIADVLLSDPLDHGRQDSQVIDVLGVADDRGRQGMDLGAGFLVGVVEQGADMGVLKQSGIHRLGDGWTMGDEGRHGRFDARDHVRAQGGVHRLYFLG